MGPLHLFTNPHNPRFGFGRLGYFVGFLGLNDFFLGITPSVPEKSLRFSVTVHYNVTGASM